jgi:hypothetical protein
VTAEIVLPRVAFDKLCEGRSTIRVADSGGRRVALFPKRVWPSTRVPALQPSVVLSTTDLDLIEAPEGLIVADDTRTAGWTIRVAP